PRNTVFVLSGRERGDLEKTLGGVKGLGLAAEHGYLYRWGDSGKEDDAWLCTKENFDDSWKDITHSVMDIYTQRTHGTYIELKGSALLWQFRDADPEFGQLQAKELHDQLTQVLESFQVEVLTGTDYLEVRPEGVDKGVMVDRVLSTLESQQGSPVDFILCIGDDQSDEFMFSYLEERNMQKTFTVTVGKKPSAAKQFLNDVDEVMEVLNALTKVTTTSNRNFSMNDLRLMEHRPFPRSLDHSRGTLDQQQLAPSIPITTHSLKSSKYSMSMSALSSAATASEPQSLGLRRVASTSATSYEQYFSNIDEEEDDHGGIFF
ncbi:trehalose-phosphatase, partial [Thraustotheca clavata]